MEFINNSDEQYEIFKYFKDIESSEFQEMSFDEKIDVLKLSLKKNLNTENISEYLVDPEQGKFEEYKFSREQFSNRRLNEMFFEIVPAILNNEDLNAMMFSIENRSPYLSKELFEIIYSIKPERLIQNGYSKNILRNNLKDILVEDVRTDRQKKGFNCSIKSLIKCQDSLTKEFLMDRKSKIFEFVDRKKFNKFLQSDLNENYKSKFLFSFLSSKIFLDNKF